MVERAGTPGRECAVCAAIPRVVTGDEGVWRVAAPLVPAVPHDDAGAFLTRCPECGAVYRYARVTERDITYESVDTELERLSDAARLAALPLPEREAFAAQLPARVERWRAALEHPAEWLRREAAWNLAALGRREKHWDVHVALVGHLDEDVRNEIANLLARDEEVAGAPDALASGLALLREDPREATRASAARALARWRLARGETRLVVDEVVRDPDPARVTAVLDALRQSATPEIRAECVRTLALLHREKAVREAVESFLQECAREGASEALVPGLLDFLRGDDPETAKTVIGIFASVRIPCRDLVPILPRWCGDPKTRFAAYSLLESQARLGADLAALLPMVGDRLEADAKSNPSTSCKVLLEMLARTPDPLPVIRQLLRGVPGAWDTSILTSIDAAAVRGADLRPVEPVLRRLLAEAETSKREFIAGWLRQLLGHITPP